MNPDCPSLIDKVQLTDPRLEPEETKKAAASSGTEKKGTRWQGALPKLPFFLKPTTYPYRAPLNYVAAGLSPLIAPIFLGYILCSFCYQSLQSRRRIKKYNVGELGNHFSRLRRVGLLQELRQDLIEELAGVGNQPESHTPSETPLSTPPDALTVAPMLPPVHHSSATLPSRDGTQYLSSLSSHSISSISHDLGLSKLQIDMLERLNMLPNLSKFFCFLDSIPNSHGEFFSSLLHAQHYLPIKTLNIFFLG